MNCYFRNSLEYPIAFSFPMAVPVLRPLLFSIGFVSTTFTACAIHRHYELTKPKVYSLKDLIGSPFVFDSPTKPQLIFKNEPEIITNLRAIFKSNFELMPQSRKIAY